MSYNGKCQDQDNSEVIVAHKPTKEPIVTETQTSKKSLWWVIPTAAGGCIVGILFAYLHIRFGKMMTSQAAGIAVINVAIFLASYLILRRIQPTHNDKSFRAMLISVAVSIPVFVLAFIGLGYEIPQMADYTAMYILGTWLGSAEAAERSTV